MLLLLLYCLLLLLHAVLGIRYSPPPRRWIRTRLHIFFPVHLQFAERARCSFDGRNVKRILFKKQIQNSRYFILSNL